MKKASYLVITVLVGLWVFGCQVVEECWPLSEDGQGAGAGGGPIIPGSGGYGEVPPEPQSATDPPPPDCNMVPPTACHQKCLSAYEDKAVKCAQIEDQAHRRACDDAAHATYKSCRDSCAKAESECEDRCHDEHDEGMKTCSKVKDDSARAKCRQAVMEQLATCIKNCKNKK